MTAAPATDREAIARIIYGPEVTDEIWETFRDKRETAYAWASADRILARGFRRAGSGEARLTEAEREALLIASHTVEPIKDLGNALFAVVGRILADRAAGENDLRAAVCLLCGHATHGDTDCGEVTGYDHLNGDHECGCPGSESDLRARLEALASEWEAAHEDPLLRLVAAPGVRAALAATGGGDQS